MTKKLCVKMFGGFSANYEGEVLTFGRQRAPKFGQLFQILMTRPRKEFNKKEIAEILYGREQVEDANASLNNTIFRLRKYLRKSPLPPGEYLILSDGALRLDGEIGLESDVWSFECTAQEFASEQDARKKMEICKRACELYRGEFLPHLSSEQWVIEKSRNYESLYTQMLEYLLRYLKEDGDFISIETFAACAAEIYPYGGWESWQIESLIARGCYQEAERAYQATVVRTRKAGDTLSKVQQTRLREAAMKMQYPVGREGDIRQYLTETGQMEGAYNTTILGFSACYHMLKRIFAREESVCFTLCLCTLLDASSHLARDKEYCKKQGERLRLSFQSYLRKGDIYAKYSQNQYLLLFAGATREDILKIEARIDVDLRKRSGGRGGVSFLTLDDGTIW